MMLKTTIIFSLFLSFFSPAFAQSDEATTAHDIALIQAFIQDIASDSLRADVILAKHVRIENTHSDDAYDYLEASIDEIRLNLQTKNLAEIDYIPFDELPRRETRDIDPEGKPTDKMYFLWYKNRQMLAVYISDEQIASFTLVSKGRQAHFITY